MKRNDTVKVEVKITEIRKLNTITKIIGYHQIGIERFKISATRIQKTLGAFSYEE